MKQIIMAVNKEEINKMTKSIMFGMIGGLTIAMGAVVLPANSLSVQIKNAVESNVQPEAAQASAETAQIYAEPAVAQQNTETVGQGYGCNYVDGHHSGTCPYVDENHTDLCPFVDDNQDGICDLGNHHSYDYSTGASGSAAVSTPSQGSGYGRHHSESGHHGGRHH